VKPLISGQNITNMKRNIKNTIAFLSLFGMFFVFASSVEAQTYYSNTQTTSTSSVALNATVNPGGRSTTGWFEYTTDPNFYSWNETEHVYVGSTNSDTPLMATLNNLVPNTVYYFRVVTNNGKKVYKGNTLSFVTTSQTQTYSNVTNTVPVAVNTSNIRYVNAPQPTTVLYTTTPTNQVTTNTNANVATVYRSVNTTNPNYVNVANPVFGSTFLPNTIFGWLLLMLIILAIFVVVRRLAQPQTYIVHK
jgi:hypothetical protein